MRIKAAHISRRRCLNLTPVSVKLSKTDGSKKRPQPANECEGRDGSMAVWNWNRGLAACPLRWGKRLTIKSTLAAVILSFCLAAPVTPGSFEYGLAAAERGDYATAMRFWRPLADEGEAHAQYNLGIMCHNGKGVPQDLGVHEAEACLGGRPTRPLHGDSSVEKLSQLSSLLRPTTVWLLWTCRRPSLTMVRLLAVSP
jgi:hypothetical protein